jgi:hypothetical protein
VKLFPSTTDTWGNALERRRPGCPSSFRPSADPPS